MLDLYFCSELSTAARSSTVDTAAPMIADDAGLQIQNQGSNPVLDNCVIRDGRSGGIFITLQGSGTIRDCEVCEASTTLLVSLTGSSLSQLLRLLFALLLLSLSLSPVTL